MFLLAQGIQPFRHFRQQIGKAKRVLGRKRQRFSKAKLEGAVKAGLRRAAFALVRHEHERLARGPHELRDPAVRGGGAGPCVDHEHDEVGFSDGLRGLLRHTRGDAARLGVFKTGGIRQDDRVPADAEFVSLRSRVRPGMSSTSASRLPANLLNRVDLPTLGRPMIATV